MESFGFDDLFIRDKKKKYFPDFDLVFDGNTVMTSREIYIIVLIIFFCLIARLKTMSRAIHINKTRGLKF